MAHLAQVTREIRIGLKLLSASLAVVALLFLFFKGGEVFKNLFFPTPPPPPEQKFGKLPAVSFPPQNPSNFTYKINTLTGKLPVFRDRMPVYKVKRKSPSLVALKQARERLQQVNFTDNERRILEDEYEWVNPSLGQTIKMNILTDNFKLYSNFLNEPPESMLGNTSKKEGAFEMVEAFLSQIGIRIDDVDRNLSTLTYLKLENGVLQKVESLAQANFGRLDLFQKHIDIEGQKYRIYYPGLSESIMYFIIKSSTGSPEIVDASFFHLVADTSNSSTYPIKTAEQAFEDLRGGNALVFSEVKENSTIDITDVFLAYYIGEESQYYLPIVVFKGKGITAYVQAIVWTANGQSTMP